MTTAYKSGLYAQLNNGLNFKIITIRSFDGYFTFPREITLKYVNVLKSHRLHLPNSLPCFLRYRLVPTCSYYYVTVSFDKKYTRLTCQSVKHII